MAEEEEGGAIFDSGTFLGSFVLQDLPEAVLVLQDLPEAEDLPELTALVLQ